MDKKLKELRQRAMKRRLKYCDTPTKEDAEINNKDFDELEYGVYSCIEHKPTSEIIKFYDEITEEMQYLQSQTIYKGK